MELASLHFKKFQEGTFQTQKTEKTHSENVYYILEKTLKILHIFSKEIFLEKVVKQKIYVFRDECRLGCLFLLK